MLNCCLMAIHCGRFNVWHDDVQGVIVDAILPRPPPLSQLTMGMVPTSFFALILRCGQSHNKVHLLVLIELTIAFETSLLLLANESIRPQVAWQTAEDVA